MIWLFQGLIDPFSSWFSIVQAQSLQKVCKIKYNCKTDKLNQFYYYKLYRQQRMKDQLPIQIFLSELLMFQIISPPPLPQIIPFDKTAFMTARQIQIENMKDTADQSIQLRNKAQQLMRVLQYKSQQNFEQSQNQIEKQDLRQCRDRLHNYKYLYKHQKNFDQNNPPTVSDRQQQIIKRQEAKERQKLSVHSKQVEIKIKLNNSTVQQPKQALQNWRRVSNQNIDNSNLYLPNNNANYSSVFNFDGDYLYRNGNKFIHDYNFNQPKLLQDHQDQFKLKQNDTNLLQQHSYIDNFSRTQPICISRQKKSPSAKIVELTKKQYEKQVPSLQNTQANNNQRQSAHKNKGQKFSRQGQNQGTNKYVIIKCECIYKKCQCQNYSNNNQRGKLITDEYDHNQQLKKTHREKDRLIGRNESVEECYNSQAAPTPNNDTRRISILSKPQTKSQKVVTTRKIRYIKEGHRGQSSCSQSLHDFINQPTASDQQHEFRQIKIKGNISDKYSRKDPPSKQQSRSIYRLKTHNYDSNTQNDEKDFYYIQNNQQMGSQNQQINQRRPDPQPKIKVGYKFETQTDQDGFYDKYQKFQDEGFENSNQLEVEIKNNKYMMPEQQHRRIREAQRRNHKQSQFQQINKYQNNSREVRKQQDQKQRLKQNSLLKKLKQQFSQIRYQEANQDEKRVSQQIRQLEEKLNEIIANNNKNVRVCQAQQPKSKVVKLNLTPSRSNLYKVHSRNQGGRSPTLQKNGNRSFNIRRP